MTLRIFLDDRQAGPKLEHGMKVQGARIGKAVALTAQDASKELLARGRADIAGAGKFGTRWIQGLHADISAGQQRDSGGRFSESGVSIKVFHDVPYFRVFEDGATIRGKPLLWIPLSFAGVPKGMWARDFPGGLFRVDRKSGAAPLLLSIRDKRPKYFGKASVHIPKKFHIKEICVDVARKMKDFYSAHWNSGR